MTRTSRPRVLLVDDHPEILVAVHRILTPTNEIVGAITVGLRVMQAASTLRPDVIVLDLNMPDISGLDLCRELVACLPLVRVVILTTISDDEVEREAYRRGAAAFVRKIEMTERLPSTIRQLFANEPK